MHRDLTPSNLLIVPDREAEGGERVKLLDFGIAKIRSGIESHTKTGECCGTPRYMAPEQCEGSAYINDRADIYTLGVLLFEMLSGQSPYAVESGEAMAWMFAHVSRRPRKLSELVPSVPPEIAQLAAEMLDKVPAQRPSAAQVVMRLRRYNQLALRNSSSTDGNAELVLAPPAQSVRSLLAGLGQAQRLWSLAAVLTAGFCAVGFFGWRGLSQAPASSAMTARRGARAALAPSGMVLIRGERLVMGSSAAEVATALAECQSQHTASDPPCQRDSFEREQPERDDQRDAKVQLGDLAAGQWPVLRRPVQRGRLRYLFESGRFRIDPAGRLRPGVRRCAEHHDDLQQHDVPQGHAGPCGSCPGQVWRLHGP